MTNQPEHGFQWSLKPYLTWMLVFGVRFEMPRSILSISFILTSLCTFLTTSCIVVYNYDRLKRQQEVYSSIIKLYENNSFEEQRHGLLSCIFPFLNDGIILLFSVAPYVITFIFAVNGNLKKLYSSLLYIGHESKLGKVFYLKVRKVCYIGLTFVILVSLRFFFKLNPV